jgi:transposase
VIQRHAGQALNVLDKFHIVAHLNKASWERGVRNVALADPRKRWLSPRRGRGSASAARRRGHCRLERRGARGCGLGPWVR